MNKMLSLLIIVSLNLAPVVIIAQYHFSSRYFKINVNSKGFITEMKNITAIPSHEFSPADKPSPILSLYESSQKKYHSPISAKYIRSNSILTLTYANGSVAKVMVEPKDSNHSQPTASGNNQLPLNPDILCLQETKAQPDQVAEALEPLSGYRLYAHSAEKKGYSGTAILTRTLPLKVSYGIGFPEHDAEGRVITLEFDTHHWFDPEPAKRDLNYQPTISMKDVLERLLETLSP